jgi:hypothetical protein
MIEYEWTTLSLEARKPGGKHHGFYERNRNESSFFLRRGIKSLRRRIAEHEEKLRDPASVPGFLDADPRRQKAAIERDWPDELANYRDQLAILQGILERRNERSR